MEFLNFFIASVIVYIALFAGYIILNLAPEEKKPGMKYFKAVYRLMFILGVGVFLFFERNIFLNVLTIFLIYFFFFMKKSSYYGYLFFSMALWRLSNIEEGFILMGAIIFAYGLTLGAIIFEPKKNNLKKLFYFGYFIIITNLLMLIL